jgi:prepilin signal peptidase PulO-like enzyme (type II secretory pathway)
LHGVPEGSAVIDGMFANVVTLLTFASPNAPPDNLDSRGALAIGVACFLGWCLALLDRRWKSRLPLHRAAWYFFARATRGILFWRTALIAVVGTALIVWTWRLGGAAWLGLLNALIGMAVGGGIVWAVRIVGFVALRREAMGFGDVTLMAMIGAFLGWQACLFIFFLAPFAGLVVGLAQFGLNLKAEIPYGPYLCMATCAVVLAWARIWKAMHVYFQHPLLIPAAMIVCMALMLVLLGLMQWVKRRLGVGQT